MSITITTVERIGEVVADPAAVANSGFLYTKDVAGITQLFYRADDGTISQLTPSTASPWTRTAAVVRLSQTGDTDVVPFDDDTTVLGTALSRWANVISGSSGHWVVNASGDANPTSRLGSAFLTMGAGGATPVDVRLARTAAAVLTIDDAAAGSVDVIPGAGGSGSIGTFATQWNNFVGVNLFIVDNPADANASVHITGPGQIRLGAGGATPLDVRLSRSAATTLRLDNNAGGAADLVPAADTQGKIGTTALRFSEVNAVTITSGDVVFTDPGCPICEQPFKEGDDLVLRVIKTTQDEHGPRTRTVPAHHGCK